MNQINQNEHKIFVGICAMRKKIQNKRNLQIFNLLNCQEISTIELWPYFDCHWTKWPKVDVLLEYHTGGLPYVMVRQYVQHYKPFMINDLQNQQLLWDRTVIYDILQELQIPVPNHLKIYRNNNYLDQLQKDCFGPIYKPNGQIVSFEQYKKNGNNPPHTLRNILEKNLCNGDQCQIKQSIDSIQVKHNDTVKIIHKPWVQKSFASNDHRVAIYYPQILGGGRRILYRQYHTHASTAEGQYQKHQNQVRKNQNYLYEEFLPTNAFDIKVYIFGDFIFAESRRSPTIDVQKTEKNIQIRHQITLTYEQRLYCKKIVQRIKQPICGLDILRSNGKSYVVDVNGWAFAKGGGLGDKVNNYWLIIAKLLKSRIFEQFIPQKYTPVYFTSYQQFMEKHKCQISHSLKSIQRTQQLRSIISVFTPGLQSKLNCDISKITPDIQLQCIQLGENMRNKSYDNYNCLGLYSSFCHDLKVYPQCDKACQNLATFFVKGFLGIKGQLSPTLLGLIEKKPYIQKQHSQREKGQYTSAIQYMNEIFLEFSQIEIENLNRTHIRTKIHFISESQINLLLIYLKYCSNTSLRQFLNEECLQKLVSLQSLGKYSHIEFKLYQNIDAEQQQKKGNSDKFRIELIIFPFNYNVQQGDSFFSSPLKFSYKQLESALTNLQTINQYLNQKEIHVKDLKLQKRFS